MKKFWLFQRDLKIRLGRYFGIEHIVMGLESGTAGNRQEKLSQQEIDWLSK